MKKIEGAIFDLDGTLVDSMWVWDDCFEQVLRTHFGTSRAQLDPNLLDQMDTSPISIGIPMLCEHFHSEKDPNLILNKMRLFFDHFYSNEVRLKEGVRELLAALAAKGVKMCIASASSPGSVNAALKHCGIDSYFLRVLTCDDVGKSKEYPDIYEAALELLGSSRENTWVFEDAVIALRTSHKMGLPTVGIFDASQREQEEIRSLSTVYLDRGESHKHLISYFETE